MKADITEETVESSFATLSSVWHLLILHGRLRCLLKHHGNPRGFRKSDDPIAGVLGKMEF